ncbi:penicillin-binding protein 1A [Aquisalimonas sp.]|uniref:penicillin-binding protein 1A n=1 Tax=Aquisalimonas sp. TaxID=1872621 RepID=UPI0025BC5104|nr:penicillin-binding protein 1A [Aquisalimonas sp.]
MRRFPRVLAYGLATVLSLALLAAAGVAGLYLYLSPQLPSVESLRDVRYQEPLRVYSGDGKLIAQFGENRREPVSFDAIPERMQQAFIASEDERFFTHPGVDYQGLARAVIYLARHQEIGPGGSTITMQVARNFFLSREQTYLRKLNEILLAFKIERELDKEQILELYLNKIYLGQRAYGIGAASQIYYGTTPDELTLAQTAMIAGLPKAPSAWNPVVNAERALQRRAYVLRRMHETGAITAEEMAEASTQPITAHVRRARPTVEAPYVAEMARDHVVDMVGDDAYTGGYRVYTTIDSRLQELANEALRRNLIVYDERHGYRGPEGRIDLDADSTESVWRDALAPLRTLGGLRPGLVIDVDEVATVYLRNGDTIELDLEAMAWARPWLSQSAVGDRPEAVSDVVSPGDVVRVRRTDNGLRLSQVPEVEGSLVSLSPRSGAVLALTGGFDFRKSQFNRAIQAVRQPGSAFKPFIYSAALENGYTPASIINDAPVVFRDDALESTWRPENYTGRFYGPTRMREALAQSRNLVSIRVLRDVGTRSTIDYLDRVGFPRHRMPSNLSLALGSAGVTPWELTAGYAIFANGGYRVHPYFVARVEDGSGQVIQAAQPTLACDQCAELVREEDMLDAGNVEETAVRNEQARFAPTYRPAERVISAQNAYLTTSMLQDVINRGTGRAARRLDRGDLAGKTGSTNELQDAWFAGYNGSLVTTAWIGYDQSRSMGRGETGARAALPMWMDFMAPALEGTPEETLRRPGGLVTVRIDPRSGLVTDSGNPDAIFETFRSDEVPDRDPDATRNGTGGGRDREESPLF